MHPIRTLYGAALVTLIVALSGSARAAAPGAAEPEEKAVAPSTKTDEPDSDAPLHFTNADLPPPIRTGNASPPPAATQGQPSPTPATGRGKVGGANDGTAEGAAPPATRPIATIEVEIARLEAQKADLERRDRVVRNPLLKGLAPPSQEEEKAVGGLAGPARLEWVSQQMAETEKTLQAARTELAAARAAPPQGTPGP